MNFFSNFLKSRAFPYIAGIVVLLLIGITVYSYLPKKKAGTNPQDDKSGLFELSEVFTSQKGQAERLQKNIEEQNNVSQEFSSWEKRVAGRYVWRRKLPLTSDKYFVYFDLTRKNFIARLYPDNDDPILQIQAEVIRILKKEIGIPLEEYSIDWDVYPKSNFN